MEVILADEDLIITADHGNDPTFKGTDRERVPLLVIGGGESRNLGVRDGFSDVGATVAGWLGVDAGGLSGEDFLLVSRALDALRKHESSRASALR